MSETSPHARLVGRIIDEIVEQSQFDYNHEGWWTLDALMTRDGDYDQDWADSTVIILWGLIQDDPIAVAILDLSYQKMKANNGNMPKGEASDG